MGHGDAFACGVCHLMSGVGHPESADMSGLKAEYIRRQMADFKSGARKEPNRMNTSPARLRMTKSGKRLNGSRR